MCLQVGSAEPDPYWQAAVNDTRICTEAAMRVEEKVQELEAMGQAAGMDENELQELQADAALEIMGPALEYDFSKWNSKTERAPLACMFAILCLLHFAVGSGMLWPYVALGTSTCVAPKTFAGACGYSMQTASRPRAAGECILHAAPLAAR